MSYCRIFLTQGAKIGGEGSGSIFEFLGTMKMAQDQCMLSEPEFLEMLLQSTKGQAHLFIKDWIDHGDTVESVFHN
jgi:prophage antirepressor-like protein